jgi:hypothetical protein
MVSRQSRIEMSVGGVKKISLWKMAMIEGEEVWEEHPNLPKSFLQVYLNRGFVESPPEPKAKLEPKVEEKAETFAEAIASGKLDTDVRIKKKIGQSKKV